MMPTTVPVQPYPAQPHPLYLARHAETVFNHAHRMQGNGLHTPLTRAGIAQAESMAALFRRYFDERGERIPAIWSSPAGRALQTAAIIAEELGVDFFRIHQDKRLREIEVDRWTGRPFADIFAEDGDIFDRRHRLFRTPIPGDEQYADIVRRLQSWLADVGQSPALVISHGMTSRVLRGLLVGGIPYGGAVIADDLPQGSVVRIDDGAEQVLKRGSGRTSPDTGG